MTESEWLTSEDAREMLRYITGQFGQRKNPGGYDYPTVPVVGDRKLRLFACACCRSWEPGAAQHPKGKTAINEMLSIGDDLADGIPVTIDRIGTVIGFDRPRISTGLLSLVKEPAIIAAQEHCNQLHIPVVVRLMRDTFGNPFRPVEICARWRTPDVLSLALAAYEERGRECGRCKGKGGEDVPDQGWRDKWVTCNVCNGTGHIDDGTLDLARLAILSDALEEAGCPSEVACRKCKGHHWLGHEDRPDLWEECPHCRTGRVSNPLLAHLRSPGPHYRGMWSLDLVLGKE